MQEELIKYTKKAQRLNRKLSAFVKNNTSREHSKLFMQNLVDTAELEILSDIGWMMMRKNTNPDRKIQSMGRYVARVKFHRKWWMAFYDVEGDRVRVGGIVSSATVANAPYLPRIGIIIQ